MVSMPMMLMLSSTEMSCLTQMMMQMNMSTTMQIRKMEEKILRPERGEARHIYEALLESTPGEARHIYEALLESTREKLKRKSTSTYSSRTVSFEPRGEPPCSTFYGSSCSRRSTK
jgi:DNA-binding GntR family transcriptional regulator